MQTDNKSILEVIPDLSKHHIEDDFKLQSNAAQPQNQDVSLSITNIREGQATVNYKLLPNSKPYSLGYQVLIFQGSSVPWTQGTKPASTFTFPNNSTTGSFVVNVSNIGMAEYIAVLQTNRRYYDSFAYSATIPTVGKESAESYPKINNIEIGPNNVSVGFSTLPGNKPKKYSNFVAIWNSSTPSFDGQGAIAFSWIPSDNPDGNVQLNTTLNRGTVYCIAYGTGPNWGTIAQYVTITT